MSPQILAVFSLVLLSLEFRLGGARVKLNSIRTVILRDSYILPMNRSIWEPSLDFTMYQCMSDLECREGSYCHSSPKGVAHSRCHSCRRRKRRCHRDGMCCPGNHCSNNICVANADSFESQRIPDGSMTSLTSRKSWRRRGRADMKAVAGKGQVGDPCLRSTDCSDGLCCARHFWTRICKPVLQEGQVCTRHRRKGAHGLELFQRCPCGDGLTCRTLKDAKTPPAEAQPASSLLAAVAANSKLASSRHLAPHTSVLSSSKSSSASMVAKTRLHESSLWIQMSVQNISSALCGVIKNIISENQDGDTKTLELNVLLLGERQSGRSSVGNALIGGTVFHSGPSFGVASVTSQPQRVCRTFSRYFRRNGVQSHLSLQGVHVIVMVVRVDLINKETQLQRNAESLFGPDWYKHSLLILTHADRLKEVGLHQSLFLTQAPDWLRVLAKKLVGGVLFVDSSSDWPSLTGEPIRERVLRLSARNHHQTLSVI
ncbi:hypothetical protein WMY93_014730 [Mugilogobius chulae]|uniref:AIG1-type G domain-containing protein n=1 Tax=Mugilogobius chulae TaxID=88201 RepID=A0AAW0P572_9GOBI